MTDLDRIEHIIRRRVLEIEEDLATTKLPDRTIGWGRYETLKEIARQFDALADAIARREP